MDQIDKRSTDLGNVVGEHTENLRSMSATLRDQGQTATAGLIDSAAGRMDGLSTYLTQTDGDRIVHDLENLARSQPLVTATLGLVGGLLAARILRASASARYRTYSQSGSYYPPGESYGAGMNRGDVMGGAYGSTI